MLTVVICFCTASHAGRTSLYRKICSVFKSVESCSSKRMSSPMASGLLTWWRPCTSVDSASQFFCN